VESMGAQSFRRWQRSLHQQQRVRGSVGRSPHRKRTAMSLLASRFAGIPFDFAFRNGPDRTNLASVQTTVGDLLAQRVRRQSQACGSFAEGQHQRGGYRSGRGTVAADSVTASGAIGSRVTTPGIAFYVIPSRLRTGAVAPRWTAMTAVCSGPISCSGLTPIGVSPMYEQTLRQRREDVKRLFR
jgi:hypothetical protein